MSGVVFADDRRSLSSAASMLFDPAPHGILAQSNDELAPRSQPIAQPPALIRPESRAAKPDLSSVGTIASIVRDSLKHGEDAYEVATSLLEQFGSIGGVLCASEQDLRRVVRNSEEIYFLLRAVKNASYDMARKTLDLRPVVATSGELADYARTRVGYEQNLVYVALYLDTNMRLIEIEEHSRGTTNSVRFYPRLLLQKAVQTGCVNVIIIRNSMEKKPSMLSSDCHGLRDLEGNLLMFDIVLHDLVIVGQQTSLSLRSIGYFDQDPS